MVWPKISIVTPSYNQGQFLDKAISSVLNQNYQNLEYILIDGGSSDSSIEVIKKYEKKISYWVSEPDEGQSDAINKGFSKATGEIFGWLNSDDYYLSDALYNVAKTFIENPDVDVVVGEADKINIKGALIYTSKVPELSLDSFFHWRDKTRPSGTGNFLQPACFFSKKAWADCGPLRMDLDYCMDVALWIEFSKKLKFAPLHKKIAIAVGHDQAKTTKELEKTAVEVGLLLSSYGGHEIVKKELFDLAAELNFYKRGINKIKKNIIYRLLRKMIKPFYNLDSIFFEKRS